MMTMLVQQNSFCLAWYEAAALKEKGGMRLAIQLQYMFKVAVSMPPSGLPSNRCCLARVRSDV